MDLWVADNYLDDFDSVEVAVNTATRRREPYRVFLTFVGDARRILLDRFWKHEDANGFAEELSKRTLLPVKSGVWH